jgi:toxin YoeB
MASLLRLPVRSLEFDPAAFEDLTWWVEHARQKARRILRLLQAVQRDPYRGLGPPERLKHDLAGCWSRRIDQEHRLVYEVFEDKIRILACRYHYRFQEKDFLPRRLDAALANAVGRLHSASISAGVWANVSRACSTLAVRASQVGKSCRGVPAVVTFFHSCSIGWSSGASRGHGKTVKRSVCAAQKRGIAADVCYVAPS